MIRKSGISYLQLPYLRTSVMSDAVSARTSLESSRCPLPDMPNDARVSSAALRAFLFQAGETVIED